MGLYSMTAEINSNLAYLVCCVSFSYSRFSCDNLIKLPKLQYKIKFSACYDLDFKSTTPVPIFSG